ncbi:MAG: META domain-containing protein [Chloroflexota bacterium]
MLRSRTTIGSFAASLLLSALVGPGGGVLAAGPAVSPAIVGSWSIIELPADNGKLGLVDSGASIAFGPDGTVSGDTGCNTLSATYTVDKRTLDIGPVTSTQVACPDETSAAIETGILTALDTAAAWSLTADGWLVLRDAQDQRTAAFRPVRSPVGRWIVTDVVIGDAMAPAAPGASLVLAADGTLGGSTGCNQLGGSWAYDGVTLDLGKGNTTKAACPDDATAAAETAFLAALADVETWGISAGQLTLYDASGQPVLVLQDPGLQGSWVLDELPILQDPSFVAAGSGVTAVFTADSVSGNSGCNQYSGPYTTSGPSIRIGPLVSTLMMCADPAQGATEAAVLKALNEAAQWDITDTGRLELYDAGNQFLIAFVPGA